MNKFRPRLSKQRYDRLLKNEQGLDTENYLVLGCVHVPFHNRALLEKVVQLSKDINISGIVLAGDFLDCNALGEYERGKTSTTGVTLEEEYSEGNKVLDQFEHIPEKVFLFGNHEARYFRWKADINNSKYGDILNPISALNLPERGYKVYSNYKNDYHQLGDLQIMHGEFFNIHAAKKTLDTFRANTMFAHTHRVQSYREGEVASWNIGWMGDVNSKAFNYANRAMKQRWANAFSVVSICNNRAYVSVIESLDGRFFYGNTQY